MQYNNPKLSVIMPVYNCEEYVAQAIQSILDQTFKDFELIIADDGSKDKSKLIIETFAMRDVRIIVSNNYMNLGKVKTVNRLFEITKGEYITIHDADDWSELNRFEEQISFLNDNPNVGFCGTNFYTHNGSEVAKSNLNTDSRQILESLVMDSQMHGPTVILRKQMLSDEIYRSYFEGYGEDYDLCLRLAEEMEPANISDYLYHYRIVKNSLSKNLTVRKLFLHDIARYLANQRAEYGQDLLQEGDFDKLDDYLRDKSKHFEADLSRIHVKRAELNMYYGFKMQAVKDSVMAITRNPFKFSNWRLLIFCARKLIF